jgi:hypothetical protein
MGVHLGRNGKYHNKDEIGQLYCVDKKQKEWHLRKKNCILEKRMA